MGDFTTNVPNLIDVAKGLRAKMIEWEKRLAGAKTANDPVATALEVSRNIASYVDKGEEFERLDYIRQAIRKYAGSKEAR